MSYTRQALLLHVSGVPCSPLALFTHECHRNAHHDDELDLDVFNDADERGQKYDTRPHSKSDGCLGVS